MSWSTCMCVPVAAYTAQYVPLNCYCTACCLQHLRYAVHQCQQLPISIQSLVSCLLEAGRKCRLACRNGAFFVTCCPCQCHSQMRHLAIYELVLRLNCVWFRARQSVHICLSTRAVSTDEQIRVTLTAT